MRAGPEKTGTLRRYALAWLGLMLLAILNGTLRQALYADRLGELSAHQLSTAILLLAFTAYLWGLSTAWPIGSAGLAWRIGLLWLCLTLAFETGMVRLVGGHPWERLLHEYDLLAGRVWLLVPLWTLLGPYVAFRLRRLP